MNYLKSTFLICLSPFFLLSQPLFNASDLQSFNIHIDDCQAFPSDFSLAPEEIYYALKYATYKDTFQVLEFGTGEGTVRLVELLQKLKVSYEYNTFENAQEFIFDLPNVTFHYYPLPPAEWHKLLKCQICPLPI